MADDPIAMFETWFAEAKASEPNDPDAMTLATTTPDGQPSARIVLLKGYGPRGFVFYTNADSRKGNELASNPQVALEGSIEEVSPGEADAYFATRGRDSQIGAWASDQSRPLDKRETFEARCDEMHARFEGNDVPRPPRWTGFRVKPQRIEFWTDRPHRLHERRLFTRNGDGWDEGLLYP
jgi:pyridoxamine 5'-phosphate oxidase